MEENKYYTPKVEELYVGFECEIKFYKDFDKTDSTWIPCKIQGSEWSKANSYDYEFLLGLGNVRVKFLDREDIESLGWKNESKTYESDWIDFIFEVDEEPYFKLTFRDSDNIINIYDYENRSMFIGTVKNKSELKKLMEMIGIEVLKS